MRFASLLVCALLLSACNKADVVDEKTFIDVYARILVIKTSTADSTTAAAQVQQVLAEHHITKEQMQQQLALYADDGDRYRRVLEAINARLRGLDSLSKPESK